MPSKNSSTKTQERIRECALTLFQQHGYDNVTVVQICEAAGITKRTFYYHFDSKEQLVNGITDYLGVKAEKLLESLAVQQTNVGTLWALMSVYSINSANYGPGIIRQIYVNMVQGKTDGKFPYSMYLYNTVVNAIANAQRAEEITNQASPEDVAFVLYHAFRSVTITWAAENGAFDLQQEFRRAFEVVLGAKNVNY
ncbi:MAG: TetR/AcrR family transcriptional regulator [Firmicutes bacterium]|nr:TetR/AcrR family transcriptional regulator [Oscillospiraceae bacterium]MBS5433688.1 TetR/AcrR family transcriptional regulator [Bacillota bacterium]